MIDRERQISPYNIKSRVTSELALMQHKRNLNENSFIFNETLFRKESSSNLLTSVKMAKEDIKRRKFLTVIILILIV